MEQEFSVYEWITDDSYRAVLRFVNAQVAMYKATQLIETGKPRRVMVTDGGDCCVFDWHHDKGVVWPELKQE